MQNAIGNSVNINKVVCTTFSDKAANKNKKNEDNKWDQQA